MTSVTPFVDWI